MTSSSEGEEDDDDDLDAQDAYYAALKSRFLALRETRHLSPPEPTPISPAVAAAWAPHAKYAQWRHALLNTTPTTRLLAGMQQGAVMQALQR